jgi:hypothetical protein
VSAHTSTFFSFPFASFPTVFRPIHFCDALLKKIEPVPRARRPLRFLSHGPFPFALALGQPALVCVAQPW